MDEKIKPPKAIRPPTGSPATVKATEGVFKKRVASAASAERKGAATARRGATGPDAASTRDPAPPYSTTADLRPADATPGKIAATSRKLTREVEEAGRAEAAARAKDLRDDDDMGDEPNPEAEGEAAKQAEEAEFMQLCRERAKIATDAWTPIYDKFREDIEFRAGKQWPKDIEERQSDRVRPPN